MEEGGAEVKRIAGLGGVADERLVAMVGADGVATGWSTVDGRRETEILSLLVNCRRKLTVVRDMWARTADQGFSPRLLSEQEGDFGQQVSRKGRLRTYRMG